MTDLTPTQWILQCAQRLGQRWRTLEPALLEEAAVLVWNDAALRCLPPDKAAQTWLRPVKVQFDSGGSSHA